MKSPIKFLFRPFYRIYQDLLLRVSNLEIAIDCLINSPRWIESQGIGFNGQRHRKQIFQELLQAFRFDAIIETGTCIGNTAGYMATTSNLPVYSCELNKRFNTLAKMRLQGIPNITIALSDSRSFLVNISRTDVSKKRVFFYLDAHWYEDLPLQEELEIICRSWKEFVIMIDDFQVPGDDGYGYDSYDGGKTLSLDEYSGVLAKHELIPFFPAFSSSAETGYKRGCVILARKGDFCEILGGLQSLVRRDF